MLDTARRQELEFVANTVIFVLSGVIIASRIYNSEHTSESLIQPRDYGYAVLLWVYLNVRPCTLLVASFRLGRPRPQSGAM